MRCAGEWPGLGVRRGCRSHLYRDDVSRSVLNDGAAAGPAIRRLPAGEIVAVMLAPGRAFRRQRRLETSVYSTISELAQAERTNPSSISRVLRLTRLGPDLVETVP